jgi:hypothetical protein
MRVNAFGLAYWERRIGATHLEAGYTTANYTKTAPFFDDILENFRAKKRIR